MMVGALLTKGCSQMSQLMLDLAFRALTQRWNSNFQVRASPVLGVSLPLHFSAHLTPQWHAESIANSKFRTLEFFCFLEHQCDQYRVGLQSWRLGLLPSPLASCLFLCRVYFSVLGPFQVSLACPTFFLQVFFSLSSVSSHVPYVPLLF